MRQKCFLFMIFFLPSLVLAQQPTNNEQPVPNFQRNQNSAPSDWEKIKLRTREENEEQRDLGRSYLVSGSLILVGSHLGYQLSNDTVSKLIYGLSQGFGVFIAAYGAQSLLVDGEFSPYMKALDQSNISEQEKARIWQQTRTLKQERQELIRKINMSSYFLLALVNGYASVNEKEPATKTVFQLFTAAYFCLGLSYAF